MFSERMKKLTPYVPGEQPQDRKYLKLNTNENPYPPSPKIEAFLKSYDIETLRRYPDPLSNQLRERIARRYKVKKEQVFTGNSSDEVLSFSFYAFFDSINGKLLFPQFTYSFYPVYCDFYGIEYEKVQLNNDFSIDLDKYLKQNSCGIIFPNPNAPTGISLELDKIIYLIENYPEERVIILDEAYIDFGGESGISLIDKYKNLLIIRTLSKGFSLAGLRLGYAMGSKELINALFVVKDSFNSYPVDVLAQKISEIAISDEEYYSNISEKIIQVRDFFSSDLRNMGWNVLPSKANFVFAAKKGITGKDIYLRLKERGVLVRYFDTEGIKDFVRITIGTKAEMERLIEEIRRL